MITMCRCKYDFMHSQLAACINLQFARELVRSQQNVQLCTLPRDFTREE